MFLNLTHRKVLHTKMCRFVYGIFSYQQWFVKYLSSVDVTLLINYALPIYYYFTFYKNCTEKFAYFIYIKQRS